MPCKTITSLEKNIGLTAANFPERGESTAAEGRSAIY